MLQDLGFTSEQTTDTPILVAIGGNSLISTGQRGTIEEQMDNATITSRYIVALVKQGHNVVITHGNGPQVGAQLIRSELSSSQVYALPLDACGASTQGEMGYVLQNALHAELSSEGLKKNVVTILTQVVVDEKDPAFTAPTKPVGPFYSKEIAEQRKRELGWQIVEDAARGYRRVVPSPQPLEIVELDAIEQCVRHGMIVIAIGGGGIPVIRKNGRYHGVEAVIDKDRASALLARKLHLKTFVISTATDRVYLHYKKPQQRALTRLTLQQAQQYLLEGHFPPGSMGPKIEAAIDFLSYGGEQVIITNPENLVNAVLSDAGTHISG
ncbi:MAG: carbamate kinase [Ignavibacteriae bacterium]|nr:carbamate kinase [Ignavibacteriota bacterium]